MVRRVGLIRIVFVCAANQCRSPMAKGLFRLRMAERGCAAEVASAGFLEGGVPVPERVLEAMEDLGVDLSGHRSRTLTPQLIEQADLIATMTRQLLVDTAVTAGPGWTKCFTLTDLVQRAEAVGSPSPAKTSADWVRQLHSNRTRADLLRLELSGDVADPINGRPSAFERTAALLDSLVGRLVGVLCPGPSA